MRKIVIYVLFLLIPIVNNARVSDFDKDKTFSMDTYSALCLTDTGLSRDVFDLAIKGLRKLDTNHQLQNPNIVTIADYSQSSNKKRLYVIDLLQSKRHLYLQILVT